MSFDPERDQRRLRLGLLVSAVALAAVLAGAGVRELRSPWREVQGQYETLGAPTAALGIREIRLADGRVDRCATCHLGALERAFAPLATLEPHPAFIPGHEPEHIGCTACHGGTGRALDADTAHALPGTTLRDPLLVEPFLSASCGTCHVPGAVAGSERLARGAQLYLHLGCATCHPLAADGRGGWDFGPDLRSLGRQSSAALRTSLFEPAADYPRSTMPSYERTLAAEPEALTDLLAFLHGLTLAPAERRADPRIDAPCVRCHSGPRGVAGGRMEHRCVYIVDRPALTCGACHDPQLPEGTRCPVIREHRDACVACHAPETGSLRP